MNLERVRRLAARWIVNLVYLALLLACLPLSVWKHWRGTKPRRDWSQRIFGPRWMGKSHSKPCLWFHAVSVGEVNLLVTLLPQIEQQLPQFHCVISAATDTGLELAQQRFGGERVFRFPIDFSWAMQRIIDHYQPQAIVLTELEVWPNLISLAEQQNIPIAVINGRLSDRSFRNYRRGRWVASLWFSRLRLVVAQSEQYAQRFRELGVWAERVKVAGSIKFDAVKTDRHQKATADLRARCQIAADELIFLAGSTSAPEEEIVWQVFKQVRSEFPGLRLVLVPRHRERFAEVAHLSQTHAAEAGLTFICQSQVIAKRDARAANPGDSIGSVPHWDVLLVDSIGELSAWWGAADIGFVGGSFGKRGGQSMIEPAGFGVAMAFGPNTKNFRDVVALLLDAGAAQVVVDQETLATFVHRCLRDRAWRNRLGSRAQRVALGQQGATQATVNSLKTLLRDI